jgi:hypothetical protein
MVVQFPVPTTREFALSVTKFAFLVTNPTYVWVLNESRQKVIAQA